MGSLLSCLFGEEETRAEFKTRKDEGGCCNYMEGIVKKGMLVRILLK